MISTTQSTNDQLSFKESSTVSNQPGRVVVNADGSPVGKTITSGVIKFGSITTQNLVAAGTATFGSAVEFNVSRVSTLTFQVNGTYTGALSVQASVDGLTWVTLAGTQILNKNTGTYLATVTSALQSIFQVDVTGPTKVRITGLAAMTGSALIYGILDNEVVQVSMGSSLQAGAASIGTVVLGAGAAAVGTVTNTPTVPTNFTLNSAATTNATSVKATPGNLLSVSLTNFTASAKFVKFYAKASAPTVGTDVPTDTIEIAANTSRQIGLGQGLPFLLGIALAITGLQADSDTTAVAAGDVKVHLGYI